MQRNFNYFFKKKQKQKRENFNLLSYYNNGDDPTNTHKLFYAIFAHKTWVFLEYINYATKLFYLKI